MADCCCSPLGPSTTPPPAGSTVEVLEGNSSNLNALNVPAQGTAFVDVAVAGAVAGDAPIVRFNNVPNSGISIAWVWPTPSGDNVRVGFVNATGAAQDVGPAAVFVTIYRVTNPP